MFRQLSYSKPLTQDETDTLDERYKEILGSLTRHDVISDVERIKDLNKEMDEILDYLEYSFQFKKT